MALPPRRWLALGALVAGACAIAWGVHRLHSAPRLTAAAVVAPATPPVPAPAPESEEHAVVPNHSNFAAAVAPFHPDNALVEDWVRAARPVFNLGHIQAGKALVLVRNAAGAPQALSYQIDANHLLWLRAQPAAAPAAAPLQWTASIQAIPYTTRLVGVSGSVQSSLFAAVENAGEQDGLAIELADIFGWDLDFYTDTRQGDVFRVLVEKRYLDGKFSSYGQIVAAEYVNAGTPYDALRFHDDLGMLAYYLPDGRPMKREFLRSPLKFAARISSGFSRNRYHPILKVYRPHLGTDFAAPEGTPVQTIGSGVVTRAGRFGGDGNMVQIRHAGGYQTLYLHLSRILVRVSQHVAQGERIGLVGMTGLATGPHLDFRIEHDGNFENFEVLRKKLPPAQPVDASLMPAFESLRSRFLPQLAKLQPAAAPAATDPAAGH